MREALSLLDTENLPFSYEGEMHVDAALDVTHRERIFPGGRVDGRANVLIFSNSETAGMTRNILRTVARATEVGPILMGMGNNCIS